MSVSEIIIANVVPEVQPKLMSLSQRGFGLIPQVIGNDDIDLGIEINIDQPNKLAQTVLSMLSRRLFV